MSGGAKNAPRTEKVLPGVWRLRLPLPWTETIPHGNAWALAGPGEDGIVLFDTGVGGEGRLRQLDLALAQAGFGVEDIRLLVCTHSHADHYGLAAGIVPAAGCELWMHPAWQHIRPAAEDPAGALRRRLEVARRGGASASALEHYRGSGEAAEDTAIEAIQLPDRDLVPGVEVETALGSWQVHETPGHAPSHVVLHQPERRLLISGDHLLGRVVVYFDYGQAPDPIGDFLASLDEIEPLAVDLVLPGHGRTFRDPQAKIDESRARVAGLLDKVRVSLAERAEPTPFEIVADLIGPENLDSQVSGWALEIVLAALDHLALRGEAILVEGTDPQRWRAD